MSKGKFLKGGIIGVIIGSIAGILFAPKSGKETREDIKDGAQRVSAASEKQLKSIYKEMNERLDDAKTSAKSLQGKAKTELDELVKSSEPLQQKVKEMISNIREGADVNQEDVKKVVDKAKKATDNLKKKAK